MQVGFGKKVTYENDTYKAGGLPPIKFTTYPLPLYPNGSLEADFLQYNSRPLTRDMNQGYGKLLSDCHVEWVLACTSFSCLQERVYGEAKDHPYLLNLVNAARFAVGGLQLDPFASPSDPIWWLTAANIDRHWALCELNLLVVWYKTEADKVQGKVKSRTSSPESWRSPARMHHTTTQQVSQSPSPIFLRLAI